ncbi:MAG: hypothetical protein AB7N76_35340 [Planctomycetota bacterium]
MSEERPQAREVLEALFPGLFQPKVLTLSIGSGLAALLLAGLAVGLYLSLDGKVALAAGGLVVWGHGAAWLVTGAIRSGPAALAELEGARWGVFLGLWWAPVALLWGLIGPG